MTHHIDTLSQSVTSYIIALLSMTSLNDVAVLLGVLLALVRLIYDTVRLYRYICNPNAPVQSDD